MRVRFRFTAFTACCWLFAVPPVEADDVSDLKAQVQVLQQQLQMVQQRLETLAGAVERKPVPKQDTSAASADHKAAKSNFEITTSPEHGFLEPKPGTSLTFYTPGREGANGEITVYGNLDLSLDGSTKGISKLLGPDGAPPVGRVGWLPDISTNISYVGVRGFQPLGNLPFNFVYQLETQLDVAASSGTGESNSQQSNVVKGALTSRNSFIGLSSPVWGSIKFGKTDAPYKNTTARLNPFSATIGDYQVIMGNTGGDNRVEFGTRLDHSIWYESPNWRGFALNALFSPGQNRASNSDNIAAGESDCTGGNVPGSGGIVPVTCSDGSFSDAVSASLSYTKGRFYATAAYERHMKVNRSSDITGIYGSGNAASVLLAAEDVADEDAAKIGLQYAFASKTTVSGIFESMHRYVGPDLQFQNERQRSGSWFALSQRLTSTTGFDLGWAHAFRTPGDPGQHNDSLITPPGGVTGSDFTAGANANNTANMLTTAIRYKLSDSLTLYSVWAMTANGPAAHYDLGAGGRAITTDCHDASDATGGLVASNPHCWTGGRLMGSSVGLAWKF